MAKRQSTLDSFIKKKPRLDSAEQQQVPARPNVVSESESECIVDIGDSSEEEEMQEPAERCTLPAVNTTVRPSTSSQQLSFPPAPNNR